jgi:hypothetical protein
MRMVLEGRQLTLNGMVYFHDERFTRDKIVCVTACSGGVCVRLCVSVCVRACVRAFACACASSARSSGLSCQVGRWAGGGLRCLCTGTRE